MTYPIKNLRLWQSRNWVKYESKSAYYLLRIHFDQILITSENKVLESLNINGKLKGVLKDDILILIVNNVGQDVRKIKFQFKENIQKCLQELSARLPIVAYGSMNEKTKITTKYRKINDVIKDAIEGKVNFKPNHMMPKDFQNFVRLCLIDPTFSQVVTEIEKILQNK